jgi:hypothetical protein
VGGGVLNNQIIHRGKVLSGSMLSHTANSYIDLAGVSLGRLSTGRSSTNCVCVTVSSVEGLGECEQV